MPRAAGRRIKIPKIEETTRGNFKKFGLVTTADLEGRPPRVLQRFISTGIERNWWNKEMFEKVVEVCWGKQFVEDLKAMRERKEREAKNGPKIR